MYYRVSGGGTQQDFVFTLNGKTSYADITISNASIKNYKYIKVAGNSRITGLQIRKTNSAGTIVASQLNLQYDISSIGFTTEDMYIRVRATSSENYGIGVVTFSNTVE